MDDRERARQRVEDAMARLAAAVGVAREAFRRLEEAHRRGKLGREQFAEFRAATRRVYTAGSAAHEAHEEYRRIAHPEGEGGESSTGEE